MQYSGKYKTSMIFLCSLANVKYNIKPVFPLCQTGQTGTPLVKVCYLGQNHLKCWSVHNDTLTSILGVNIKMQLG